MTSTLVEMPFWGIRTTAFMQNEIFMARYQCNSLYRGAKFSHLPGPFGNVLLECSQQIRDAAKHPTFHKTKPPHDKELFKELAPNVCRAKTENPAIKAYTSLEIQTIYPY